MLNRLFDEEPPERFGEGAGQAVGFGGGHHFFHHILDAGVVADRAALALDVARLFDIGQALGQQFHQRTVDPVNFAADFRHRVTFDHVTGFRLLRALVSGRWQRGMLHCHKIGTAARMSPAEMLGVTICQGKLAAKNVSFRLALAKGRPIYAAYFVKSDK